MVKNDNFSTAQTDSVASEIVRGNWIEISVVFCSFAVLSQYNLKQSYVVFMNCYLVISQLPLTIKTV